MNPDSEREYKNHAQKIFGLLEVQEKSQDAIYRSSVMVFILSKKWLGLWKSFVNYDFITEPDYLEKYPITMSKPAIINEDIIAQIVNPIKLPSKKYKYCNQFVKSSVTLNDILMLTKELWEVFTSEYLAEEIERPIWRNQHGAAIFLDLELIKFTVAFISKSFCNWIENNRINKIKLNFVQFYPEEKLSDLKREIAFALGGLDSNPLALNPFTNRVDYKIRLRTPVESANLRIFKLNPKMSIIEVFDILKAQCKADANGNYIVDFPGNYLEKNLMPKLDNLKLKSTDILFIEVRERESTWILKTKDLRARANDSEDRMIDEEEEKKEERREKKTQSRNERPSTTCSICAERYPDQDTFMNFRCQHHYCISCVQSMLLDRNQIRGCGVAECNKQVEETEINAFLENYIKRLDKRSNQEINEEIDDDDDPLTLPDRLPDFSLGGQYQQRGPPRGTNVNNRSRGNNNPGRGGSNNSSRGGGNSNGGDGGRNNSNRGGNNTNRVGNNTNRRGSNSGQGGINTNNAGNNSKTGRGNSGSRGGNNANTSRNQSNRRGTYHPPPQQNISSHFANVNPLLGNLSLEDQSGGSQQSDDAPIRGNNRDISQNPRVDDSSNSKDGGKKISKQLTTQASEEQISQSKNSTMSPVDDSTGTSVADCIICMAAKKNAIFIPCGHMACCLACAQNCKKICPICRKKGKVNQVFNS